MTLEKVTSPKVRLSKLLIVVNKLWHHFDTIWGCSRKTNGQTHRIVITIAHWLLQRTNEQHKLDLIQLIMIHARFLVAVFSWGFQRRACVTRCHRDQQSGSGALAQRVDNHLHSSLADDSQRNPQSLAISELPQVYTTETVCISQIKTLFNTRKPSWCKRKHATAVCV